VKLRIHPSVISRSFFRFSRYGVFFLASWLFLGAQVSDPRFESSRTSESGLHIRKLKTDTWLGGRMCRQGWVHLHPNGTPAAFTSAVAIDLGPSIIPAGTWVLQDPKGTIKICAFPGDTEIQGHLCRGSGGPKGIATSFYPSGTLKQYFLHTDTVIQGIPCQAGLFNQYIELHENGRLKGCALSLDFERESRQWRKGTRIHLGSDGTIQN